MSKVFVAYGGNFDSEDKVIYAGASFEAAKNACKQEGHEFNTIATWIAGKEIRIIKQRNGQSKWDVVFDLEERLTSEIGALQKEIQSKSNLLNAILREQEKAEREG